MTDPFQQAWMDRVEFVERRRDDLHRALAKSWEKMVTLRNLLEFCQWQGLVWRPSPDGAGHHLVAGCPMCCQAKDVGHHAACRIAIALKETETP